jgi:tellurite methyltransferase
VSSGGTSNSQERKTNEAEWEERYRAAAAARCDPSSTDAMPLLTQLAAQQPPGRALDLACGLGRNSIWLAERGWTVTAVDRSETAIATLQASAASRQLPLHALVADLESHEFVIEPGAWDLIVVCNYFQRDLYEPALRGLVPGGVLIASALLSSSSAEPKKRFRVEPGELRTYFCDCEIVHYREDPEGEISPEAHGTAEIAVRSRAP